MTEKKIKEKKELLKGPKLADRDSSWLTALGELSEEKDVRLEMIPEEFLDLSKSDQYSDQEKTGIERRIWLKRPDWAQSHVDQFEFIKSETEAKNREQQEEDPF